MFAQVKIVTRTNYSSYNSHDIDNTVEAKQNFLSGLADAMDEKWFTVATEHNAVLIRTDEVVSIEVTWKLSIEHLYS